MAEKAKEEAGDVDVDLSELEGGEEGASEGKADELAELQAMLADGEESEGEDAPEKKAEPEKEPPKEAPKEPKREKFGEGWKKLRKERAALDERAAALAQREAALAAAEKKAALLDRLAQKDTAALEEAGIDLDGLLAAEIARAKGEPVKAGKSPIEKKLEELEAKLREREETAASAAIEQEAVRRFEGAISKEATPLLAKLPPERRIALGGALAGEIKASGQRVPLPEVIAGLLEKRLLQEAREMAALLEDEKPTKPSGITSISRQHTKGKSAPKAALPSADEEMAELQALLR